MNKYRIVFWGRKRGALGVNSFQCRDVEAPSREEAILKLYETHEHISDVRFVNRLPQ